MAAACGVRAGVRARGRARTCEACEMARSRCCGVRPADSSTPGASHAADASFDAKLAWRCAAKPTKTRSGAGRW